MAETPKKPTTRKKTSASASAPKAIAPKRKATASKVTAIRVSHEEIARLAHKFWAERGMRFVGAGAEHGLLLEKARETVAALQSAKSASRA